MNKMIISVLIVFHFSFSTLAIAMDTKFEANVRKVAATATVCSQENHSVTAPAPPVLLRQAKSLLACPKCQRAFTDQSHATRHAKGCGKSLDEKKTLFVKNVKKDTQANSPSTSTNFPKKLLFSRAFLIA